MENQVLLSILVRGERDALEKEWLAQTEILDYRNWLQAELLKARKHAPVRESALEQSRPVVANWPGWPGWVRGETEKSVSSWGLSGNIPVLPKPVRESKLLSDKALDEINRVVDAAQAGESLCLSCKKEFVPPTADSIIEEIKKERGYSNVGSGWAIFSDVETQDIAEAFHQSQIRCEECKGKHGK